MKRRIPPGGPLRGQAPVATCTLLVSCSRNKHIFRCDQNGPPAERHAYFGDRTPGSDQSTSRDFRRGFYGLAEQIL